MDRRRILRAGLALGAASLLPCAAWSKTDKGGFTSNRLTVAVEGDGRDVILIPGLTSSPDAWRTVTPRVPGHRWHYVQVKGFAGTPADGNAAGGLVAGVAEEIARYIRETGLDRPAIVGHSMGGTVALMVAARHPQAAGRIMVVDQVPFMGIFFGPPGTTGESVIPVADATKARMDAASDADNAKALTAMVGSMVANEAMRPKVIEQAIASDRKVVSATFRELIVTDLRPELPRITAPATILYVNPANTGLTNEQVDAIYQASYTGLADVKLVRVPDSAHFIMFDNADRFVSELTAFLG